MLSLRKHFGTAGLLVAVLALVAALGGSAVAANSGDGATASAKNNRKGGGNVNNLIKRESRKFSKRFSLAFSKRFPGPMGPQGFPGVPGVPGSDGDDGSDGADGSDGTDGKSVVTEAAFCGGLGGTEFEVDGSGEPSTVCNGEPGVIHPGETLPSGASLTGAWSAFASAEGHGNYLLALSFPVPLENAIAEANLHYGDSETTDCPGTAADPEAKSGHLCVYPAGDNGAFITYTEVPAAFPPFLSPAGAVLAMSAEAGANAWGSFAVTAP